MDSKLYSLKTSLLRKDFDLLRNSRPSVPMYADGRELLVFQTFSQSASVPKRIFRHAETPAGFPDGRLFSAFLTKIEHMIDNFMVVNYNEIRYTSK